MYFDYSKNQLEKLMAYATASEIYQQPDSWLRTEEQFKFNKDVYRGFVSEYVSNPNANIVFAGAGSSEYIGNTLQVSLKTKLKSNVQSISTTDLLTNVSLYLSKNRPTLMVSFARSGNSPESIGAFLEVQNYCDNVKHLFITCNVDGDLAQLEKKYDNILSIVLAKETHDAAFAMTSSFTNMYLMALLIFDSEIRGDHICSLSHTIKSFLSEEFRTVFSHTQSFTFDRIVFLGSHVNKWIAQESALKILELTCGECPSLYDSFLGFRHGPKSFLNEKTLSVMFMSTHDTVRLYEKDLLIEMSQEGKKENILIIDVIDDDSIKSLDHQVIFLGECRNCPSSIVAIAYLVVGQILGLFKSLQLCKTPDNPDPSGSVNRVVKGVKLYNTH